MDPRLCVKQLKNNMSREDQQMTKPRPPKGSLHLLQNDAMHYTVQTVYARNLRMFSSQVDAMQGIGWD